MVHEILGIKNGRVDLSGALRVMDQILRRGNSSRAQAGPSTSLEMLFARAASAHLMPGHLSAPADEQPLGISKALAHTTAQLDALKECYRRAGASNVGRVPDELAADNVPERAFLDEIAPVSAEFKHDEDDFGLEEVGDKENAGHSATLRPNSPAHSSSAGYDPHKLLTTNERQACGSSPTEDCGLRVKILALGRPPKQPSI
ncbi:hypothetical protein PGTUg99_023155 [Puccinia graminis f. sp. tritici]|uniref:Uncharacterized protein n=1 Tax=Puccinia graminis f. sp. tritici TaxID=56615 RepID=A0A5B0SMZ6_PUCGR|nr:hypothetical protein PGTUg99_023155 [Puccinia graminis f. sp. tritici]